MQALQLRWEDFLQRGRAVVVVGDLNICPAPIDSCDPEPNVSGSTFDFTRCERLLFPLLR